MRPLHQLCRSESGPRIRIRNRANSVDDDERERPRRGSQVATIREYAEEVSSARVYGGIHYRNSALVGMAMGKKIGDRAVQNYLKPVH